MDPIQKSKTLAFLTEMFDLHNRHIKLCNSKEDYYSLFTAALVFKKFTESQFKEDFSKYEDRNYGEVLASLDSEAKELVEAFFKQHHKKLN